MGLVANAIGSIGIEIEDQSDSLNGINESELRVIDTTQVLEDVKDKKINKNITTRITKVTREACVKAAIIPEAYINTEFDREKVIENHIEQSKNTRRHDMANFKEYMETVCDILNSIRRGEKIQGSYVIGAPNGLGKTSFVHTALMLMYQKRMRVVPYISLSEIAELKVENEKRLARGLEMKLSNRSYSENLTYLNDAGDPDKSSYIDMSYYTDVEDKNYYKKPTVITGQYSYSEYLNTDILFCFLTEPSSKEVESYTLKSILEIRAAKGLPTIVMVSTSLNPYKNHNVIGPLIWQEILSYSKNKKSFDRLEHISCFRLQKGINA